MMRRLLEVSTAGLCALLAGCATSSPVLVEPRTPDVGELRTTVGGAALAPIGGDHHAIGDARAALSSPTNANAVNRALPGTAVALAARPGVAPVVRASVGVYDRLEGFIRYGGRDVGIGGRYVLAESRTETASATTLSVGGEGRFVLQNRPDDSLIGGLGVENPKGYGGAVPFILAWQSDGGLLLAYVAATVGYDHVGAQVAFPGVDDLRLRDTSVSRVFGVGTFGLGIGLRRVHAIIELGLERDWIHATFDATGIDARLWSLTPAFALSINL